MKLKVYQYEKCGTCRKALKFLAARRADCMFVSIRENPPTKAELRDMLTICGGDIRKLFNTSGQDYKRLKLSEKLHRVSTEDALDLLAGNGNLVKRPFVVTANGGFVGFKEEEWGRLVKARR